MKTLFYFFLLLAFISCGKEGKFNDFILWEKTLPSTSEFNTIYDPIIYENMVIFPDKDAGILLCLDKLTGEELWRWTEASDTYGNEADGFTIRSYIHNNVLVIGFQNLLYGLDIQTGQTIWHNRLENNAVPFVNGLKSNFINREWIFHEKIWITIGDITTGVVRSIYEFERDDQFNVSGGLPDLFTWEGIDYAVFTKHKWGFDEDNNYIEDQWLHLYNLTEEKLEWVSDTIPLEFNVSGIAGKRPVFEDGQILLANDAIYSYNIEDGSLEWRKYYGNSFVLSTHLSADYGRVYGNNASGYMVSLDVHTGEEYFNVVTGGSASRIVLNDNKVYIGALTGAQEVIQILDAFTGNLLRSIAPPYMTNENNRHFDGVLTVDPETGYLYTADHIDMLCFDPQL